MMRDKKKAVSVRGSGDLQRCRAGWLVTLTPYKARAVSSNLSNGMY